VKTQVWIAISVYVLVAILKKRLNLDVDMYRILQILSVHLFEKVELLQVLTGMALEIPEDQSPNQLTLFEL
jgi:hypothetical protein